MSEESVEKIGKVTQVMGPVVDAEFKNASLPEIYTALRVTNPLINDKEWNLVLEVAQQLGGRRVRCIAMDATDGLVRGAKVLNTEEPIKIPVGKKVLGRLMNVIGEPIDEMGSIEAEERWPIHHDPPKFVEQTSPIFAEAAFHPQTDSLCFRVSICLISVMTRSGFSEAPGLERPYFLWNSFTTWGKSMEGFPFLEVSEKEPVRATTSGLR